ncbi:Uncharacterized protein FWK35_00019006 [Aphis craccivora]|uniref:Dimer Tnp hAT domain-containing protein n=1 Tax=Aphis craccivora TaxID=307492 RepID=A0A6G0YRD5_APHCR|nr:Uncharacterized protein FWK35_00019006 [Aphis craccivora]
MFLNYFEEPCQLISYCKIFILQYNTPTSSASVERLFSFAMMTSLPKSNRLSDDLFEYKVLFMLLFFIHHFDLFLSNFDALPPPCGLLKTEIMSGSLLYITSISIIDQYHREILKHNKWSDRKARISICFCILFAPSSEIQNHKLYKNENEAKKQSLVLSTSSTSTSIIDQILLLSTLQKKIIKNKNSFNALAICHLPQKQQFGIFNHSHIL